MPRVVDRQGDVTEVPAADLDLYLARGYTPEDASAGVARAIEAGAEERYSGIGAKADAALAGLARGATFGGSDLVASAIGADTDYYSNIREYNPITSGVSELVGGIAPAFAAPGSIIASTPAGIVARGGEALVGAGRAAGGARAIAGAVGGGALEGVAQGAGSYISDVALGDKELSGEAFVGAMKQGGLFGGAAGGVFGLGEKALTKIRKLFPAEEVTREAAQAGEVAATRAVDDAVRDSETMANQVRDLKIQRREILSQSDLDLKLKLNQIKLDRATQQADSAARIDAARVAKAEAPRAGRKPRAAMEPKGEIPAATVADDLVATPVASSPSDDLMAQLTGTKAKLDAGADFKSIRPDTATDVRAVEDAIDDAVSAIDPTTAKLVKAERAHREAADAVGSWRKSKEEVRGYADDIKTKVATKRQAAALERGAVGDIHGGFIADKKEALRLGREVGDFKSVTPIAEGDRELFAAMSPKEFELVSGMYDGTPLAGRRLEVSEGQLIDADTGEVLNVRSSEKAYSGRGVGTDPGYTGKVPLQSKAVTTGGGSLDEFAETMNRLNGHAVTPTQATTSVDDALSKSLREPAVADDLEESLDEAAQVVGKLEQASADLVDALGPMAPPGAAEKAAAYRAAVQDVQGAETAKMAQLADDMANKGAVDVAKLAADTPPPMTTLGAMRAADTIATPGAPGAPAMDAFSPLGATSPAGPPAAGGGFGGVQDLLGGYEALQQMGIPLPSLGSIPIVGPLLSTYLKARMAVKAYRRLGGKIGSSAETRIASKAAETKTRITRAVGKMLDASIAGTRRATTVAPPAAAILAHRLFDRGEESAPPAPAHASEGQRAYLARIGELAAASQPGAVKRSVQAKFPDADPRIVDAIVATTEKRLQFLDSKVVRPPAPASIFGAPPWAPSKANVASFARVVGAVDDPAGVLERAANGDVVTADEADALRVCYPKLFQDAQRQLLEKATSRKPNATPISYAQRVMLSNLFDAPLDSTADPSYAATIATIYEDDAPPPEPMPGAQVTPSIAADVNLAQRSNPDAGRRSY